MRTRWPVGLVVLILVAAGCGSESGGASEPTLTVSAATSLKNAFTAYGKEFKQAEATFSFAGSDELAAQIQQGVKPDVFAAANTKLPDQLFAKGLVKKPKVFAGNRLVLAVSANNARVASLRDLEQDGVTVAIGAPSVPVGAYTRTVLGKLPPSQSQAIKANVRSEEPDVGGIVGKLSTDAADAGFVYISDVRGAGGRLRAIELPKKAQPSVAYGVAVVKGAKQPKQAEAFIDGLVSGPGQQELKAAGFEPPPAE